MDNFSRIKRSSSSFSLAASLSELFLHFSLHFGTSNFIFTQNLDTVKCAHSVRLVRYVPYSQNRFTTMLVVLQGDCPFSGWGHPNVIVKWLSIGQVGPCQAHRLSAAKIEHSHWSTGHSTCLWLADKSLTNLWAFQSVSPWVEPVEHPNSLSTSISKCCCPPSPRSARHHSQFALHWAKWVYDN